MLTETASQAMHDRAHTFYGTDCPAGCDDAKKWAARRLITPRAFLTARGASQGLEDMAYLLGVTTADVCNYVASLDPDEWLIMVRLTGTTGICDGASRR
jgi:hypothetical protein